MKHTHRFYVSTSLGAGQSVILDGDDSFHAARVLRLKQGDHVELADPSGTVFDARVTGMDGVVEVRAEREVEAADGDRPLLTVAQAVPKGKKMDLVVEKLSEIGVERLQPLYTHNSVAREGKISVERLDRWRRIARAAASQSHRPRVMEVAEPLSLASWLKREHGRMIVFATEEEGAPLGALEGYFNEDLVLVIGPEAGFSPAEVYRFREAESVFAGLGPLIMRTETAALVAATVILHRQGVIG